jgi:hypothetical protein
MPGHDDRARTLVAALQGDAGARGELGAALADDVVMIGLRGRWVGRDAVLEGLADPAVSAMVAPAAWSEPVADGETASVRATLPATSAIGGFDYAIHFDPAGRIDRIEQQLVPPAPLEPAPLGLGDDVRDLLAGALANRTPTVVAYVAPDGRPHVSLRATTQVLGPDQIAIWIRDPQGGLLRGIEDNPNVTIWYRDAERRVNYQFYGHARRDDSDATRDMVYDRSPEPERNLDPSRRGVAVVVELDRVEGSTPDGRVLMLREG